MFFAKCLLWLIVLNEIDSRYTEKTLSCATPRIQHGRARTRQKSKMVRYMCFPGYDLVGNKYATCKDGQWDELTPVCVRPGCDPLPKPNKGIQWKLHGGAWIVTFCLPGYSRLGSPVVYCDGRSWNATAPVCVETVAARKLSCDFEEGDICGWTQDDLHDFDWIRQNKHTPSHFLNTGPSYDHTFGDSGNGHYMYIESTSRLENDTARLISPIFSANLAKNGCFSFWYHMFGKTTGSLKIYQKPDNIALQALLQLPAVDQKRYMLFEKRGDQGDAWYSGVAALNDFNDNFQIVIEGVRGSSFTSDIAVDDVAILQGENCTVAKKEAVTPSGPELDSCAGRCDTFGGIKPTPSGGGCYCSLDCLIGENCCPDFFELCIFEDTTPDMGPEPQTQKLVASASSIAATAVIPTSTITGTFTTKIMSTTRGTPLITQFRTAKIPPSKLPDILKAGNTSSKPSPLLTTSRAIPTTKQSTTTQLPQTVTIKTTVPARATPKLVFKSTTAIYNATGRIKKDNNTRRPVFVKTTKSPTTTIPSTKAATVTTKRTVVITQRPSERKTVKTVKTDRVVVEKNVESRGLRTGIIVITSLIMLAGMAWFVFWARGATGRASIARLRGRTTGHSEVRFLTAHADDEVE